MAELKKSAIKKAIRSIEKSYDYHSYNGKYDVLVDLDELVDLIVNITTPTTTEAEIRAMAIDEFAERCKELVKQGELYDYVRWCNWNNSVFKWFDRVAEQLREE